MISKLEWIYNRINHKSDCARQIQKNRRITYDNYLKSLEVKLPMLQVDFLTCAVSLTTVLLSKYLWHMGVINYFKLTFTRWFFKKILRSHLYPLLWFLLHVSPTSLILATYYGDYI